MAKVIAFKPKKSINAKAALERLRRLGKGGPVTVESYSGLAAKLGWDRKKTWKQVARWEESGKIVTERDGAELRSITALPDMARGKGTGVPKPKRPQKPRKKSGHGVAKTDVDGVAKTDVKTSAVDVSSAVGSGVVNFQNRPAILYTYQNASSPEIPPQTTSSEDARKRENTSAKTTPDEALSKVLLGAVARALKQRAPAPLEASPIPSDSVTEPIRTVPPAEPAPNPIPSPGKNSFMNFFRTRRAAAKMPALVPASSVPAEAPQTAPAVPAPQRKSNAVERAVDRPFWRRKGGGSLTTGGGGGDITPSSDFLGGARWWDVLAFLAAVSVSGIAAFLAVEGLLVLFPGEHVPILVLGASIECLKFFGAAALAAGPRSMARIWRWLAFLLVLNTALLNAAGVASRLTADHAEPAAVSAARFERQESGEQAKIDVAQSKVQDLNRQIAQIDDAVSSTTRRGRGNSAMRLREREQRNRARLAREREQAQRELADDKAGQSDVVADQHVAEGAAMPIRYIAQFLHINGDPEHVFRWIVFMIVLAADPSALVLTMALASKGRA